MRAKSLFPDDRRYTGGLRLELWRYTISARYRIHVDTSMPQCVGVRRDSGKSFPQTLQPVCAVFGPTCKAFFLLRRTGETGARNARVFGSSGKDPRAFGTPPGPVTLRRLALVQRRNGCSAATNAPPKGHFCRQVLISMRALSHTAWRDGVRHFFATVFRFLFEAGNARD